MMLHQRQSLSGSKLRPDGCRTLQLVKPPSVQASPVINKSRPAPVLHRHLPTLRAAATEQAPSRPAEEEEDEDEVMVMDGADTSELIYDQPMLYDAAFSYRNLKDEVSFIQKVYQAFGGGAPLTSVIDLGCGPGHHAIKLAQAGIKSVLAIDTSAPMLQYAGARAAAAGAAVTFAVDDIRTFKRPPGVAPVDMCLCLLATFSHMLDNEQAASCMSSVLRALRPGGLFVLELSHPGDLFDGTFIVGDGGKEVWEVPIDPHTLQPTGKDDGDCKLMVEWGAEFDALDPVSQVLVRTVSMSVLDGSSVKQTVEASVPQRMFTVQELALLAQITGFEVLEMYGEMSMDVSLGHEDAYRLVMVLRKGAE